MTEEVKLGRYYYIQHNAHNEAGPVRFPAVILTLTQKVLQFWFKFNTLSFSGSHLHLIINQSVQR